MKSTMITKAILGQKTSIVSGEIHILNIVLTPLDCTVTKNSHCFPRLTLTPRAASCHGCLQQ